MLTDADDAELRAADPAIGYKDTADVTTWLDRAGLAPVSIVALPANNLGIIAGKP